MPGVGTLTLSGTIVGLPTGQQTVNVPWSLPNAVGDTEFILLSVGDNPIPVPPGTTTMLVVPPDGNAISISMKDSPTDVGIALHPQAPCFRSVAGSVTVVYLTIPQPLALPVSIAFW